MEEYIKVENVTYRVLRSYFSIIIILARFLIVRFLPSFPFPLYSLWFSFTFLQALLLKSENRTVQCISIGLSFLDETLFHPLFDNVLD